MVNNLDTGILNFQYMKRCQEISRNRADKLTLRETRRLTLSWPYTSLIQFQIFQLFLFIDQSILKILKANTILRTANLFMLELCPPYILGTAQQSTFDYHKQTAFIPEPNEQTECIHDGLYQFLHREDKYWPYLEADLYPCNPVVVERRGSSR